MLTVYLDQNKWIDLARAETGHRDGVPFVEALAILKQAVDDGRARFPLGSAHYFETGKQGDRRRRMDLASTMLRLAGQLRIAPPHVIVPWELRRALIEVFDLPSVVPDLELFGLGVAHAFSAPSLRYKAPAEWRGIPLPPEWQDDLQSRGSSVYEAMILADVAPEGMPSMTRLALHNHKNLTDARFVEGQSAVADKIRQHGRRKLDEIMLATAYTDIRTPLVLVATELGVSENEVASKFKQVLEATPSRWVEMKLRHQRQANPQKVWEGNDLNDVTALAIAVPYCDVVVTERSWSSMLAAARVPQRFDTTVTPSLHTLMRLI